MISPPHGSLAYELGWDLITTPLQLNCDSFHYLTMTQKATIIHHGIPYTLELGNHIWLVLLDYMNAAKIIKTFHFDIFYNHSSLVKFLISQIELHPSDLNGFFEMLALLGHNFKADCYQNHLLGILALADPKQIHRFCYDRATLYTFALDFYIPPMDAEGIEFGILTYSGDLFANVYLEHLKYRFHDDSLEVQRTIKKLLLTNTFRHDLNKKIDRNLMNRLDCEMRTVLHEAVRREDWELYGLLRRMKAAIPNGFSNTTLPRVLTLVEEALLSKVSFAFLCYIIEDVGCSQDILRLMFTLHAYEYIIPWIEHRKQKQNENICLYQYFDVIHVRVLEHFIPLPTPDLFMYPMNEVCFQYFKSKIGIPKGYDSIILQNFHKLDFMNSFFKRIREDRLEPRFTRTWFAEYLGNQSKDTFYRVFFDFYDLLCEKNDKCKKKQRARENKNKTQGECVKLQSNTNDEEKSTSSRSSSSSSSTPSDCYRDTKVYQTKSEQIHAEWDLYQKKHITYQQNHSFFDTKFISYLVDLMKPVANRRVFAKDLKCMQKQIDHRIALYLITFLRHSPTYCKDHLKALLHDGADPNITCFGYNPLEILILTYDQTNPEFFIACYFMLLRNGAKNQVFGFDAHHYIFRSMLFHQI